MSEVNLYDTLDFTIEVTSGSQSVTLLPVLLGKSPCEKTLVASFLIDGIEMIESARIVVTPGKEMHPFPGCARIHHPVLHAEGEDPDKGVYTFTIHFYRAGAVCCTLEKKLFFPAEKLKDLPEGKKLFPQFIT